MGILSKVLGSGADAELGRYRRHAENVVGMAETAASWSDDDLRGKTNELRGRIEAGESLEGLVDEAFAAVIEAAVRTTGMKPYLSQVTAGLILVDGNIAELDTGEGKTLMCTMPAYYLALAGKGCHVVTANEYLATRDSHDMAPIYNALGMSVGVVRHDMSPAMRREAYLCDITYGTNSEFGFDYLRDNMATSERAVVQRGLNAVIVDEIDSILIDEARTPLIVSGSGRGDAGVYREFAKAVRGLAAGVDYELDMARREIMATDAGLPKIEARLGRDVYADPSGADVNHLLQALKAEYVFERDRDYIVTDGGEVKIVDEFTGRAMDGRRWSDGLHQAVEAKEGVVVREESQTLATITIQNYFRMYGHLCGMTGTAMTEDAEFRETYGMGVMHVPPHRPNVRVDHTDRIYRTHGEKVDAIVAEVARRHAVGQPVLVGTVSIESSEELSRAFDRRGIRHSVLNAKNHAKEAAIVAQAGRLGAVTIATNMAGRGTDIKLGGNATELAKEMLREDGFDPCDETTPLDRELVVQYEIPARMICHEERQKVLDAGGLCIIGTERHESRRIDNQLRGRAGRQGDRGETEFFLSLDDDLMQRFGGEGVDRAKRLMEGLPYGEPIASKMVMRAVEAAQHKVESVNYQSRKDVLDYDDVLDKQRAAVYAERNALLHGRQDAMSHMEATVARLAKAAAAEYASGDVPESWDIHGLAKWYHMLTADGQSLILDSGWDLDDMSRYLERRIDDCLREKVAELGVDMSRAVASKIALSVIDVRWRSYLDELGYLRAGIGLRGFAQRDPLVEYRQEAYDAFGNLVDAIYEDQVRTFLHVGMSEATPR